MRKFIALILAFAAVAAVTLLVLHFLDNGPTKEARSAAASLSSTPSGSLVPQRRAAVRSPRRSEVPAPRLHTVSIIPPRPDETGSEMRDAARASFLAWREENHVTDEEADAVLNVLGDAAVNYQLALQATLDDRVMTRLHSGDNESARRGLIDVLGGRMFADEARVRLAEIVGDERASDLVQRWPGFGAWVASGWLRIEDTSP